MVASLVTTLQPAQAGGAQAFVCDLAQGLAGRGHEVEVYCAAGSSVEGVTVVPIAVAPGVAAGRVRPGGGVAAAVPELSEGFERLFQTLEQRGADAVTVHAFDAEVFRPSRLRTLHTLHLPPLVATVVAAAKGCRDPLVTVSEACRRDWVEAGLGRVGVILNGVPDFDPGPVAVARRAIIAGRISPEKGIEDAIAAARQAGLPITIVGDVYDPQYRQSRLAGVDITPGVARPALWRLLAASAVTVLPVQWEEPFGLVAAESQVAGCPVAAYRRGGLPEVVEEGVSGFLAEPGDVEGLVRAITSCLSLDRVMVRASARRRLLIDRAISEYEVLLSA